MKLKLISALSALAVVASVAVVGSALGDNSSDPGLNNPSNIFNNKTPSEIADEVAGGAITAPPDNSQEIFIPKDAVKELADRGISEIKVENGEIEASIDLTGIVDASGNLTEKGEALAKINLNFLTGKTEALPVPQAAVGGSVLKGINKSIKTGDVLDGDAIFVINPKQYTIRDGGPVENHSKWGVKVKVAVPASKFTVGAGQKLAIIHVADAGTIYGTVDVTLVGSDYVFEIDQASSYVAAVISDTSNIRPTGDINSDGSFANNDLVILKRKLANWSSSAQGMSSYDADYADVNGDGSVTNADLTVFKRLLAGWTNPFNAAFYA